MHLTTGHGVEIENPSAEQVEDVIRSLPADVDSFVILLQSDERFIQAARGPDEGFSLEYRNGPSDKDHYRALGNPEDAGTAFASEISLETVVDAFKKYSDKDIAFRDGIQWEQLQLPVHMERPTRLYDLWMSGEPAEDALAFEDDPAWQQEPTDDLSDPGIIRPTSASCLGGLLLLLATVAVLGTLGGQHWTLR